MFDLPERSDRPTRLRNVTFAEVSSPPSSQGGEAPDARGEDDMKGMEEEGELNYDYMKDVMREYRGKCTFSKRLNNRLRGIFLEPQPPSGYR